MFANQLNSVISSQEQQVSAVLASRDFLLRLTRPQETPRVPPGIRREALALLRHFPATERLRPALEQHLRPAAAKQPDPLVAEYGLHWPAVDSEGPSRSTRSDALDQI